MDNLKSNLFMKNLSFINISLNKKFNVTKKMVINHSFDVEYHDVSSDEINVFINYHAQSDNGSFSIDLKLQGNFIVYEISDEKVKSFLLHVNTIAIMFPYLRSQISLLTTQPGLTPIQIPIVDATALAYEAGYKA